MPIYEYQCKSCGARTEELQRVSDPPLTTCKSCDGPLVRLVSAPAVQFKGEGWYVTDYAGKGKKGKDKDKDAKTSGDGGGASDGASSSDGKASSEAKSSSSDGGGSSSSSSSADKKSA